MEVQGPFILRRRGEQSSALLIREKSSYLRRPLQHLFPFEILDDVKKEPESDTEDVASVKEGNLELVQAELSEMPLRPRRQAARAGEERRGLLTNAWSPWLNLLELKTKLRREHIMIQLRNSSDVFIVDLSLSNSQGH